MPHRRLGWRHLAIGGVSLAALVALSCLGSTATARWQAPAEFEPDPSVQPSAAPPPSDVPSVPVREEEVTVEGSGEQLAGAIVAPEEPGSYPGVVLVHGAGRAKASDLREMAGELAQRGVAALVYDKRSDYTLFSHDFNTLAQDALGAVRLLREQPDVDPQRVGLWGFSEGGWVLPLAATAEPELVDFLILVSPSNVPPRTELSWRMGAELAGMGAWRGVQFLAARAMGSGGFADYAEHDPVPVLERVEQPVLALYGAQDRSIPVGTSAAVLRQSLDQSGNRSYRIRYFAGAGHAIERDDGSRPPDYLPTMAAWLDGLPETAEPPADLRVTGAPPEQEFAVADPPAAPPAAVRYGLLGLAAAGYLAGPALALAFRLRGGRLWGGLGTAGRGGGNAWRRRGRLLAATGAGSYLLGFATSGAVFALAFTETRWVAAANGMWLLTRAGAVLAVVLAAAALWHLARGSGGSRGLTGAQRTAVLGAAGATAALAGNSAFWGMYAPSL